MGVKFSSIFKGLANLYESIGTTPSRSIVGSRLYIAEVVDVVLSKQHAKYTSESDLGAAIVRNLDNGRDMGKDESSLTTLAYPVDVSTTKIPLPGEFVVVIKAAPGDYLSGNDVLIRDVYLSTITNLTLLNYNGIPFAGTTASKLLKNVDGNTVNLVQTAAKRHESRFNTFLRRQIKRLRPYDGDTIIQGRFGNSIRLGSTIANPNKYGQASIESALKAKPEPTTEEEKKLLKALEEKRENELNNNESTWSKTGLSGDPIIIMRTRQPEDIELDLSKENYEQLTVEDINRDGSSVYLCQNQQVSLKLQIANVGLRTWRTNLGLQPPANNAPQPTKTTV